MRVYKRIRRGKWLVIFHKPHYPAHRWGHYNGGGTSHFIINGFYCSWASD